MCRHAAAQPLAEVVWTPRLRSGPSAEGAAALEALAQPGVDERRAELVELWEAAEVDLGPDGRPVVRDLEGAGVEQRARGEVAHEAGAEHGQLVLLEELRRARGQQRAAEQRGGEAREEDELQPEGATQRGGSRERGAGHACCGGHAQLRRSHFGVARVEVLAGDDDGRVLIAQRARIVLVRLPVPARANFAAGREEYAACLA